jgi:hypothetical protein
MKHIEIFESYNKLTKEQQEVIENFSKSWYESKIIDENGKDAGGSVGGNHKLEDLCKNHEKFNKAGKCVRIIIENKRRILSEEEIDLINKSQKYNL